MLLLTNPLLLVIFYDCSDPLYLLSTSRLSQIRYYSIIDGMAKRWVHGLVHYTQPVWYLLVLLTTQSRNVLAQDLDPLQAAPSNFYLIIPTTPVTGDSFAAFTSTAVSSALPSSTDSADYATHDNNTSTSSNHAVLNYYFLLLAVVVVVIGVGYWSLARRRKRRSNALRNNQQNTLARDLETWPGRRRAGGWRHSDTDGASPEEGLNDRGEAPPAYVKEPAQAHVEGVEDVELRDLENGEGKPPDYEAGPAR